MSSAPPPLPKRRWRWLVRVLVALVLVTVLLVVAAYREVYRSNGEVTSSGRKRSYLLYVSQTYQANRPTALVT